MKNSLKQLALLLVSLAVCAGPVYAQQNIEIEDGAVWTHPHSSIAVPATLGGLPRDKAQEYVADHLNIGFSFREGSEKEELSIYIYRHTNGGIPVWFEQARQGLEGRDIYAGPQLAGGIEQYAWPGAEGWQGHRALYDTPDSTYSTSTGIALFSVDGWFVKMRATSDVRSAVELGAAMDTAFRELIPPEPKVAQLPLIPVVECEEKLAFKKKAKDAKNDGTAAILSALLGGMVAEKVRENRKSDEPSEVVAWCRDGALSQGQVAYRANASTDSYLIALGDSGMGVSVAPDSAASLLDQTSKKKDQAFAITVITESQRINYTSQNRLPSLKRVMKVINDNKRVSAVSTWGEDSTIELSSDAI